MNRQIPAPPGSFSIAARLLSIAVLLFGLACGTNAAQLSASVDRKQIGLEETLTLTLRFDEQVMSGEPDFNALKQDFDILGNRRTNQYRSINGQVESFTQWNLTLAPKKEGSLQIPALNFKGEQSDPITIQVEKSASSNGRDADQPIFLETEVSKQQVYVQEQLLLTLRLYTSVDLSSLDSEDFKVDNALVKQLAENQFQKVIDGQRYGVVEVTYAVFPQQSGQLTLPAVLWNVTQQSQSRSSFGYDPFLNRGGKLLRLRSEEKVVSVLPSPDSYDGQHWLPAQSVTLQQNWSRDPNEFRVGEPITRKLEIKAAGLMASQIPPLQLPPVEGVRYYPDQPQSNESLSANGVTSVVTESYAIVPGRAGQLTLPEVSLQWWDTAEQTQRQVTLPAETIEVKAAVGGSAVVPSQEAVAEDNSQAADPGNAAVVEPGSSELWFYASLALACSSLMFALLWWRARATLRHWSKSDGDKPAPRVNEKAAWRNLQRSLESGECAAVREALLAWAQVLLAPQPIFSLQTLASKLPPLSEGIDQLQRNLYKDGDNNFDVDAFRRQLNEARQQGAKNTDDASDPLPPLYPSLRAD